LSYAPGITQL